MRKSLFFAIIFSTFFAGCMGPDLISPIITGVVIWQEGEAHKYYNFNSDIVYRASKHALKEIELEITKDEPNLEKHNYHIIAGNNDKFSINIVQVEKNITDLKLRVNFMGDKPYAELFYKKVDEKINTIYFNEQGVPSKKKGNRIQHKF